MAIQGVSFMGREGCIEPAKNVAKNVAKKVPSYFGHEPTGNVEEVAKRVEKTVEKTVRPTDVKSYVDSHSPIATVSKVSADEIAAAYRASHGIPSV